MLSTTPTLLSQRAEPSPLWLETFPQRRIRRGTTRNSQVRCEKAKRGYASRFPPSSGVTARRTRGAAGGESDPPFFGAGAPPVRVKGDTACATLYPPLSGEVALSTVIPGGKAVKAMRNLKRSHRPQAACHVHQNADSGSNNPKSAGRYRCRHPTSHRRRPFRPFHTLGRRRSSVDEMHSSRMPLSCQIFPEGTLPYGCRPSNQCSD